MKFKKFNSNPKGNKSGDCVIRAISIGLNKSWIDVYDDLVCIGRKNYMMPTDTQVIINYLESEGCEHTVYKAIKGKKREKVSDFNNGTHILFVANHLTVVVDGVLIDTFDCRDCCVYRSWKVK